MGNIGPDRRYLEVLPDEDRDTGALAAAEVTPEPPERRRPAPASTPAREDRPRPVR